MNNGELTPEGIAIGFRLFMQCVALALCGLLSGCYSRSNFDMLVKENIKIGSQKANTVEALTYSGFICKKSHLKIQENIIWCSREVKFFMPPGRCSEVVSFEYSVSDDLIIKIHNILIDCPVMVP